MLISRQDAHITNKCFLLFYVLSFSIDVTVHDLNVSLHD
jgi:hypothetical protein